MRLHDVSAPLGPSTDAWPGDTPFEATPTARISDGDAVNLTALRTSPHNGTHADAPLHVDPEGAGVDDLPLEPFLGPAVVLDREQALAADRDELARAVPRGHRVLLRSGRKDPRRFPEAFRGVPPGWIERIADRDVPLLGVDLPSVDDPDSRELPAHRACVGRGVQILENLALTDVAPGAYTLVALPLKLEGLDGSPVRAVLIEDERPEREPRVPLGEPRR